MWKLGIALKCIANVVCDLLGESRLNTTPIANPQASPSSDESECLLTQRSATTSATLNEDLEGMSRTANLGAVGSQRSRIVTHLPQLGARARLQQGRDIGSSWTMELSIPLNVDEGDFILGSFLPDRAESPPIN